MRLLVCVDGSRWAYLALQHAGRRLQIGDEVVLLTVCPRAGAGYLECGRMTLEAAQRICGPMLDGARVRTRLMVGDPRDVIPRAAAEEEADLVVMGALGGNGLPYGASLGDTTRATWASCACPVLVGSPLGVELLAGDEALQVATRQELSARAAAVEGLRPPSLIATRPASARGVPGWGRPDASAGVPQPLAPVSERAGRRRTGPRCEVAHTEEVASLTAVG